MTEPRDWLYRAEQALAAVDGVDRQEDRVEYLTEAQACASIATAAQLADVVNALAMVSQRLDRLAGAMQDQQT